MRIFYLIALMTLHKLCIAQSSTYFKNYVYHKSEKQFLPSQVKQTFISFHFGISNYLGDLGGNSGIGKKYLGDNNFKKNTYMYGFSITKMKKEKIAFRLGLVSGKVSGSDADVLYKDFNDKAYSRYKRNLDFRTNILEGSLLLEIYPLKFLKYTNKLHQWSVQPYVIGGLGIFKFNPEGSYYDPLSEDNVWTALHPLRTEGQGFAEYPDRKEYKLTQLNMPFGAGVSLQLGYKSKISLEFISRKLFTDYLDDVSTNYVDSRLFKNYLSPEDAEIAEWINNKSNLIEPSNPYNANDQRGTAKNFDTYFSFGLKLSFQINQSTRSKSSYSNSKQWIKFDKNEICQ
jgi:hypothetical protein